MCLTCGCTPDISGMTKVERIKAESNHLRGAIKEELANGAATFGEASAQILKFHGIYQQDERDKRKEARLLGLDKYYQMMIRTRIPGGIVSPAGYLAHDRVARGWGDGTLRITTRQDFQTYGVLKGDLHRSIRAINDVLMTTLGGCGDQERNVMCCPAPIDDPFHDQVLASVAGLVRALTPSTGAYAEIWLDGELAASNQPETEPLYGDQYLPRKFKTAVALEGDNCVDVYSNDLGIVAMRDRDGSLAGFNVLVGGGLGRTANKPNTWPAVGLRLGFVEPDGLVSIARAIVSVQRDYGDRADRRHARLKYTVRDLGIERFRAEVEARAGLELRPPREMSWEPVDDHLGWHDQGDGKLYLGLYIENGRLVDRSEARILSAIRCVIEELGVTSRLTAQQNLLLTGIEPEQRPTVERILSDHGVQPLAEIHRAVRHAMACPALPTCGLAVAESERVLPDVIRRIATVIDELGLGDERISYRMTGCPNGCARPYLGDVGFVGTTLGKYDVFLGGDFEGTRLNVLYAHNVPLDRLEHLLRGPLTAFRDDRKPGEGFGDWCHRIGVDVLGQRFAGSEEIAS